MINDLSLYKNITYEMALKDDVQLAIKIRADEKSPGAEIKKSSKGKKDWDKYFEIRDQFPPSIPNHPLLTNYDWVYENAEVLLTECAFSYQRNQGFEEYYMFFKVVKDKYNLEDDYNKVIYSKEDKALGMFLRKWQGFASDFIYFFANAFDLKGILDKLFTQKDFTSYFFRYPLLYTPEVLANFGYYGMGKLSFFPSYANYYIAHPDDLITKLRRLPKLQVDERIFHHPRFIRQIAHNSNVCKFYYDMMFVWENCSDLTYLEEHQRYCDKEVLGISDGVLPSLIEEYSKTKDVLDKESCNSNFSFYTNDNWLRVQVGQRIFEHLNVVMLPKREFYRELSKYMIVGMLMSRLFLTDPYDLYIDIETLYEYATKNGKELNGMAFYEFLIHFEEYSIDDITDFYHLMKDSNMREILYDDINREKENFISSVNDSLVDFSTLDKKVDEQGIEYFDLTENQDKVLVSNTSIPITRLDLLEKLVSDVKAGKTYRVCMSLQDKKHRYFYSEGDYKRTLSTIKFVYGKLDPQRVGIFYHRDAYSHFMNETEVENRTYKRRFYTLKEFMDMTFSFNEIVYLVAGEPFVPIGVLVEEKISQEEVKVAKDLGVPIFFYHEKDLTTKVPESEIYIKQYNRDPKHKTLFP